MRKVIQIFPIAEDDDNYGTMYALLDNGEIWSRRFMGSLTAKPKWEKHELPPPCLAFPEDDK